MTNNVLSFGDWFVMRRKHLNYEQQDLADRIGVHRQVISNLENNSRQPKFTFLQTKELMEVLQVDLETLINASEGKITMNYE